MSPSSFSREYLSVLVYQVSQPGVVRSNRSSSSLSEKALLPTTLIWRILATSPSNTSKLTPTRLRGKGVTVEVTSTPYLPLPRYCSLSSYSARSSIDWSKMRPSPKPTCISDVVIALESNSRMPLNVTDAIVGRSWTTTTTTSLSVWMRTSLKKPVAYRRRTASVASASVNSSPTFTGRDGNGGGTRLQ